MTEQAKNDRALRFYTEVLGLRHLHYGLWEEDEELSLTNLRKAQQRYEDLVVDAIPEGVHSILDVGCGNGMLSRRLKSLGYDVEGLSPDVNQRQSYPQNSDGCVFHFSRFEHFSPERQYDCIIMSESGQYIPLERLFRVAAACLSPGGYLINIDYFVLPAARGVLAKSGHPLDAYRQQAVDNGFDETRNLDISKQIAKTLDLARLLVERGLLALDIATEKFRRKHPLVTRLTGWLLKKKKRSLDEQLQLLDTEKFLAAKQYRLFVFRKKD